MAKDRIRSESVAKFVYARGESSMARHRGAYNRTRPTNEKQKGSYEPFLQSTIE